VSYREPMFLITDDGGAALGAVAVEDGHWVGRDTAGRTLFDRKNLAGATAAARPIGRLVSTAWYGIRDTRPGEARSERVRHDRRGLPYVTDPWPMYVTRAARPPSPSPSTTLPCAAGPATRASTTAWPGTPT
jgi:hypothetical protein